MINNAQSNHFLLKIILIIKSFINILIILIFINKGISQDNTVGLILNDTTQSYKSYTLFAPVLSNFSYLIDNEGKLINQWESEYFPTLSAYLLENGHLLRAAAVEELGYNQTGGFQEFNWDGELVWQYYYGTQHHDIEPMPNGNVLIVVDERKNKSAAIQAGRDINLIDDTNIRSLSIIEVEQIDLNTGKIIWRWNVWDHLIQDFDYSKNNFGTVADHPELIDINFAQDGDPDWLHANSVSYDEEFDQIIISNRGTNEIWVIDHSTTTEVAASHSGGNSNNGGDLLYRWGNPQAYGAGTDVDQKLFGQHDSYRVESGLPGYGNIIIFNNGWPDRGYSSIEEIIPPVDVYGDYSLTVETAYEPSAQLWTYTTPVPTDFNSQRFGGSQRLPNGNTLICNSFNGEFKEVTPNKDIVWKYVNPINTERILVQGETNGEVYSVFRCYKYGVEYPGIIRKDPGELLEVDIDGDGNLNIDDNCPRKFNPNQEDDDGDGIGNVCDRYPLGIDHMQYIDKFVLEQNCPNPFNPSTIINYSLSNESSVTITIYDMLGRKINELVSQKQFAGDHSVEWNGKDLNGIYTSAGIYFYQINTGDFVRTKKMVLIK